MGKNKQLRKRIEGIDKAQKIHWEKIEEYTGKNDSLIPYWEREIKDLERKKEDLKKKLEKKKE